MTEDDVASVLKVLRSDHLTQGPVVAEFESKFADYVGIEHGVAVSSGTAALHLALLALGLQPGQSVVTSPNSFVASANCIRYCGGTVRFVDVEPDTGLLDLDKLEKLLESLPSPDRPVGVIPVHFAGMPVDLERLAEIAGKFDLWVLEDACHAPGAEYQDSKGQWHPVGACHHSEAAAFSFHPVKHIATGEGGMVTSCRGEVIEKIRILRTHGITREKSCFIGSLISREEPEEYYYEQQDLGFNYRMPDTLAALGYSQLSRARNNLTRRKEIAAKYDSAFQGTVVRPLNNWKASIRHAYHLYVIRVSNRDELYRTLRANGVYAQVHYIPIHLQPYYAEQGFKSGQYPQAERYYSECLSLPMYPTLSQDAQEQVIDMVLKVSR